MKELPKKHAKKRGPVEVIQGKNTRIPIYDAGAGKYIAAYYAEGKRKLVKFQSLEAAKRGAKEIIEKLTTGIAHVATFTPKQTAAINDAADALRPTGVTLTEAARQFAEAHKILSGKSILHAAQFYARHLEEEQRRGALTPITFPELAEKFMASIRGKKSKRYVIDLETKLKKAARAFSGQIREIRADDIDAWLSGMTEASGRTKNNYRMALLTLFSYARDKRHLPRGERTEAEFSTRYDDKGGNIGIYTPEEFRVLLTNIDERFLPFVALGGFAGLTEHRNPPVGLAGYLVRQRRDRGRKGQSENSHKTASPYPACSGSVVKPPRQVIRASDSEYPRRISFHETLQGRNRRTDRC